MKVGGYKSYFLNSKEGRKPLPEAIIKALLPTDKEAPKVAAKKEAKKEAAAPKKEEGTQAAAAEEKAVKPAAAAPKKDAAASKPAAPAASSAPAVTPPVHKMEEKKEEAEETTTSAGISDASYLFRLKMSKAAWSHATIVATSSSRVYSKSSTEIVVAKLSKLHFDSEGQRFCTHILALIRCRVVVFCQIKKYCRPSSEKIRVCNLNRTGVFEG